MEKERVKIKRKECEIKSLIDAYLLSPSDPFAGDEEDAPVEE